MSFYLVDIRLNEFHGKRSINLHDPFLTFSSQSHSLEDLTLVQCEQKVVKKLPSCGHSLSVPCHQDPRKAVCQELCGGTMLCCSRSCRSKCSDCQQVTKPSLPHNFVGIIARTSHVEHPCERLLYCQHNCGLACSQNHDCNSMCAEQCRQTCSHHACTLPCWQPCPPCMEPCDWTCAHVLLGFLRLGMHPSTLHI